MEWQAVEIITTTKDYTFTPVVTGTLFKLKHTSEIVNKSDLKIVIRQAFEDNGQLALFDYKLINCKVEQDILLFSLPRGLTSRKLAIKRVDNLSDSWSIEIESLDFVEQGVDMPITLSDLFELQQQINSIQDALTLKALDIDLDNHVSERNNPHSVTASQIGAEPVGSAIAGVLLHESTVNHPTASRDSKGLLSAADKYKLDGIENNATANATDAYLANRSNHTGLQSISTITSLQDALDAKQNNINILPIAKGGTGSNTQTFVDLTNNQTVGGIKTFSSSPIIPNASAVNQAAAFGQITASQVGNTSAQWNASQLRGVNISTTAPTSGQILLYSAANTRWEGQGFSDTLHGTRGGGNLHTAVTTAANGFMLAADKAKLDAIASGATANNSDAYLLNRANHTGISTVSSWIAPTFLNSWTNHSVQYAVAGYRKLPDGTVEIKGLIKKATTPTIDEVIFNLPIGYRPLERRIFAINSGNAHGRVDVDTLGNLRFEIGVSGDFSLEGIKYVAEQ